jgi:hypothetical protein
MTQPPAQVVHPTVPVRSVRAVSRGVLACAPRAAPHAGGWRWIPVLVLTSLLGVCDTGHAQADHLECFRIEDPLQRQRFTADLDGLVAEPGCKIKVPAELVCVPTRAANVDPAPPVAGQGREPGRVLCYRLACDRGDLPPIEIVDPFGARTVVPSRAKLLCAPELLATTTTVTSSTTTTTTKLGGASCCENALGCADVAVSSATVLCDAVEGTVIDGQSCNGATGRCAAQTDETVSACCEFGGGLCAEGPLLETACAAELGGTLHPGEVCSFSVGIGGAPVATCAPAR